MHLRFLPLLVACRPTPEPEPQPVDTDVEDSDSDAPTAVYTDVDVNQDYGCALTDAGALVCFGDDSFDIVANAPAGTYTAVSAGTVAACALDADSLPVCWGSDFEDLLSPPAVAFVQIAVGMQHACGRDSKGGLQCWGSNFESQISGLPTEGVAWVSATDRSTCVVKVDGTLLCVGQTSPNEANLNATPLATCSHSSFFGCGLTPDGSIGCWGQNTYNLLTQRPMAAGHLAVDSGTHHACALTSTGAVDCWGDDSFGQQDAPEGTFTDVSLHDNMGCAVADDGAILCFGFQALEPP